MGLIDDHLANASDGNRAALERVYSVAREVAPDATEGESYGMPALLYRGKGLVAALEAKAHLGVYPFSGSVLPSLAEEIGGFEWSPGAIKFTADEQLPDALLRLIVETRIAQIDQQLIRRTKR